MQLKLSESMEIRLSAISFAETFVMRYFPIAILFFFLVSCQGTDKKPAEAEKKPVSQHSAGFNQSFDAMMNDYYALTEAFVNWDSNAVITKTASLQNSLKAISLDDIKGDTAAFTTAKATLGNITANTSEMASGADITTKRHQFNDLSQNIFDLMRAVKYDEKKLYLQRCSMPFDDGSTAVWLTDKGKDSIRNPYLGLHHPHYGGGMIECGENVSTIDFQK